MGAITAIIGKAAKGLFGIKAERTLGQLLPPEPQPLPPIPEPAVAPVADDQALKAKARRKVATVRQRSGRLSTINTAPLPGSTVLG